MSTPRILAFGGSLRRDSYNQKLAAIAAAAARKPERRSPSSPCGISACRSSMKILKRPKGNPEAAKKLKELFLNAQGFHHRVAGIQQQHHRRVEKRD